MKIRGTASHIHDKYQSLARDANSSGDRIMAENYLQHAEHYLRLINALQNAASGQQPTTQPAANGTVANGTAANGSGNGARPAKEDQADQPQPAARGRGRRRTASVPVPEGEGDDISVDDGPSQLEMEVAEEARAS